MSSFILTGNLYWRRTQSIVVHFYPAVVPAKSAEGVTGLDVLAWHHIVIGDPAAEGCKYLRLGQIIFSLCQLRLCRIYSYFYTKYASFQTSLKVNIIRG